MRNAKWRGLRLSMPCPEEHVDMKEAERDTDAAISAFIQSTRVQLTSHKYSLSRCHVASQVWPY